MRIGLNYGCMGSTHVYCLLCRVLISMQISGSRQRVLGSMWWEVEYSVDGTSHNSEGGWLPTCFSKYGSPFEVNVLDDCFWKIYLSTLYSTKSQELSNSLFLCSLFAKSRGTLSVFGFISGSGGFKLPNPSSSLFFFPKKSSKNISLLFFASVYF